MRKADDIKRYIKDTKIKTNPEVNKAVLHDLYDRMEPAGFAQQHIGRLIMKSKRTKFAAAAVIMIAALIGINLLNGTPAWADVADDLARVDYAHVYYLKSRDDVLKSHFEAWYV
ncbi:MAG: hypothetical protein ACYSUT_11015, partial [Planctomycetota bacterium]